jgi:hypothetical protein
MAYNLILNSNNAITNNTYRYTFINSSITILDEAEMCISQLQIPYSWFNITTAYNNQQFQIIFPTSSGLITTTLTLNDGFFTVTNINAFIQQFCITNGYYLINASGNYVYYLTLLYNINTYGVQLITTLLPTSLPAGYSQPSNWAGYNVSSLSPQLVILNNNFGNIIGFAQGTFPPVNTANSSTLNTYVPLGSNVNSVIVRCSLVDNKCGLPTDILDVFPINTTFGSNINYQPYALKYIKISAGIYQYIDIIFEDQNFNTLAIQDTNLTISLLIKNKGKDRIEPKIEKLNIRLL